MKNEKYLIPIIVILLMPFVNAAVGVTSPAAIIELRPGESARFQFEIQTVLLDGPVACAITFNTEPFNIKLDNPSPITIEKGLRYQVYGTITAPSDIGVGSYKKSFSVACSSIEGPQGGGAAVQEVHGFIPFNIDVVNTRTRENPYIPPQPEKQYPSTVLFLIFVLIIIVLFIILLVKRNKKPRRK